jgi:hypothetical protein
VISVQAIVTSIELRNPTESQPIEITQLIFQSASKGSSGNGQIERVAWSVIASEANPEASSPCIQHSGLLRFARNDGSDEERGF